MELRSWGVIIFIAGMVWRVVSATEVVVMDFSKTSPVATLFGSNAQVNDNQKVQNRLFDERIIDRGFEWTQDQKWTSNVVSAAATVTQDCTQRYAGRCSAQINVSSFPGGSLVALVQTAVWVEAGATYSYSFWAKQTGYGGSVVASMIEPVSPFGLIVQSSLSFNSIASDWTHYAGQFTATQSEVNGPLLLQFNGTGTVWVDGMSLTPTVTQHGVSPTLYNAFGEMGLKAMRFGAGSESNAYDWRKAIGSRDQRETNVSVFHYFADTAGNGYDKKPYYNDFGVDEFLQMSAAEGWEPVITVNLASGPVVAAQWVEYCNGDASTPYGSLRAANGHSSPYNVKYWEVGNEIWNQIAPEPGTIPNSSGYTQANTDNYIAQFKVISDAMKAVDPTIWVGAVGAHKPADGYMTDLVDPNWNEDLLAGAASKMDFIATHIYATGRDGRVLDETTIYNSLMGAPLYFEEEILHLKQLIAATNPNIKIAITEYAAQTTTTTGNANFYFGQNLQSTLYMASMKNLYLRQGVTMANQFDLLNESSSLLDFTLTAGNNATLVRHGPFLLETLYADFLKPTLVESTVGGASLSSVPVGWMRAETAIPMVDVLTSNDSIGRKVSVFLVNRNKDSAELVDLTFGNFYSPLTFERGGVIAGADIQSRNTVDAPSAIYRSDINPSTVIPLPLTPAGDPRFQVTLPKASVSAFEFSYSLESSQKPRLYPNPFIPSTHSGGVTLSPVPEGAQVSVYTLAGKLVKDLSAGDSRTIVWDGFSGDGKRVASGVYMILIKSAQGKTILKLAIQN